MPSGAKGKLLNTSLGSGHPLVEKRMVPYEIKNAPNAKSQYSQQQKRALRPSLF